jgi:hypothetical protein
MYLFSWRREFPQTRDLWMNISTICRTQESYSFNGWKISRPNLHNMTLQRQRLTKWNQQSVFITKRLTQVIIYLVNYRKFVLVQVPIAIQKARDARRADGSVLEYGLDWHLQRFLGEVTLILLIYFV